MIKPRSYRPVGQVLSQSYETMLQSHPEAFDCIIYPAKSSEHNEIISDNKPVGTLLDRDERAQEYDAPVLARAMIVPKRELAFDATDSGLYESFHAASEAMTLMLSILGLRRHSLVQWKEFISLTGDETVDRMVYIADEKPVGRTLNAQMLYTCYPLPAMGEKPQQEPEMPDQPDPGPENPPDVGIL